MQTVIYADVLVAVNIFVTYILLVCTRLILKCDTNKWGLIISVLFGGFSSLIVFWQNIPLFISILFKVFGTIAISFVAFLPRTKKMIFKTALGFLIVNIIFGGFIYLIEITFKINSIYYINGVVYFDISVLFLVAMTLICYGVLLITDYFLKRRTSLNTLYKATLYFKGESVSMTALYDTGNYLVDGIEGKPVIIAELSSLMSFFDNNELDFFKKESLDVSVPDSLKKFFRVIPCSSINGSSVLMGFIPESLVIETEDFKYVTESLVVAVTKNDLSSGEYNCILNCDIFERGKRINENKVNK